MNAVASGSGRGTAGRFAASPRHAAKSCVVPTAPSTLNSIPPAGSACAIASASASSLRMIAPAISPCATSLASSAGCSRAFIRAGTAASRCQRKQRNGVLEQIGKDGRDPAAGRDAACRETGCDRVDLGEQLPVGERAVGAVVDQRKVIRRAFAGNPNKVIRRLHGDCLRATSQRATSPAACCSSARRTGTSRGSCGSADAGSFS